MRIFHLKNCFGHVDNGVRPFFTAYTVLQPAIVQYEGGGCRVANNVAKILNRYGNIRSASLEADGHINHVGNTLAKKILGLTLRIFYFSYLMYTKWLT